jgi:EmrB/QacA subfamily drug resistance transporter
MAEIRPQPDLTNGARAPFNSVMEETRDTTASRFLFPVLFVPIFMVVLDIFIVNVAAPSLRSDLGATDSEVQWVVAAYLITYAISLITGGRLGDVVGRRRMFRIGVAGFTAASALCAAAPTAAALICARLLQGFAGAAMWPQVLSIIQVELAPNDRPRAFGFQGLVQGLAAIAGQIVGGGLIALDVLGLGWRAVFLINVPVGLAALAAAGRVIPESRSATARRVDPLGIGLASLVLALIMIPVIEGRDLGWPVWGFVALAAAVPTGALFVAHERRLAARGGAPLAELRLFEERGFRIGVLSAVILYGVISFFLLLSIYLQDGLGLSAIDSGLAFTPLAIAFVAGSLTGPRLSAGARDHLPQVGAAVAAVGLLATLGAVEGSSGGSVPALLIPALVPVGAGLGLAVPTLINLVLRGVPTTDAGAGSGILTTSQQIGNALGVGIVGTIFFAALGSGVGPASYGDAFSLAIAVQAVLALISAALVSRAHARMRAHAPRAVPARESS